MNSILRKGMILACVIVAALAYWGCSDDDGTPTNGGPTDTAPPEVSSVTATEVRSIDVVFNEAVDKTTAEDKANYFFVKPVPAATSGDYGFESPAQGPDTLWTVSAILQADGKTVTAATDGDMQSGSYNYYVSGVEDLAGNVMTSTATGTFAGSTIPDDTPPVIVFRSPAPNETGVDVSESVVVQFSEPMQDITVESAFTLSNGGVVLVEPYVEAGNTYRFEPMAPLTLDTEYTVVLTTAAMDMAGNTLEAMTWKFRTADDNTPPRFEFSIPDDRDTNVPLDTNIELQFSEPINQNMADGIVMTPDPGDGDVTWSTDGSRLIFDPYQDLDIDTQYTIVIPAGGVEDLAGNPIDESVEITFTTGSSLESGRISGRLSGDSGSQDASNAGGALVFASTEIAFDTDGPPSIFGTAIASSNGNYDIQNLPDNT
ncbi:MAG: Ig-like domain-containing protein, partial [Candidatus Krumholzibacteria bacterium]|nr:Ig-like domain-containing protein [Candidatus Krumholzibacteria bacterium]